jgi:GDP-fucose transporter C1
MFKVGSCAVVTAGLVVGAFGEGPRFSAAGTGLGIASTFFVALYAVLVRRHTDAVGGSMWRLAWYNTVLSCALLPIVAVLSGEFGAASAASMAHGGRGDLAGTLVELTGGRAAAVALTVSGILGFLVSLASYAQITLTDPLTHMVSGTVKGLLQTFIGAWVFGTPLTALNLAGSVLVVAGSLAYSLIRMSESREAAESKDGAAVKSKKSQ